MTSHPAPASRRPGALTRLLAVIAGIAAIAGVAAIWAGLTVMLRSPCAWMALVVALDAALLLRLAGFPSGRERAIFGVAITALTIIAAGYLYATAQIGLHMGMLPSEAVWLMRPGLAWLYVEGNVSALQSLWALAGLMLAWKASR